jgi:hypothetical protein
VPIPAPPTAGPPTTARRGPAVRTAVAVAVLAGPLLAGCSALIPGHSEATGSAASAPTSAGRPQGQGGGSGRLPEGACQITVSGRGSVQASGGSSDITTINGATTLSCGGGPELDIDEIADGAVALSASGAAPVRIAAGETAAVASYQVTVSAAQGDAARFVLVPG